jgi:hypothetical protein
MVTYADDDDLLDKIAYYLAHEDERMPIARAGHQRTQAQHAYSHRARAILEAVTAPSFERLSSMRPAGSTQRRAARRTVYTHLHMLDAILDEARDAGVGVLARAWAVLPVLARRLMI